MRAGHGPEEIGPLLVPRQGVETLLRAHDQTDPLLDRPAAAHLDGLSDERTGLDGLSDERTGPDGPPPGTR
jgi:hypothetical protein